MVKVLIVDDSSVELEFLDYLLSSDPVIKVIGKAKDGEEAIKFLNNTKPDVITMDIHMPNLDGYETTKYIMGTNPVPIVIVSASSGTDVDKTYKAIQAGALAFVEKPVGFDNKDFEKLKNNFVQTVKLMSEVKLVKRRYKRGEDLITGTSYNDNINGLIKKYYTLIVIGVSTGGPATLQTMLSKLPKDFSIPIIIVQHIASGFLTGLIDWLSNCTMLNYRIPTHNEIIQNGYVYFAPDDFNIGITNKNRIVLSKDEIESGLRPSVSYLFRSAAQNIGEHAIGIIMTGMGKDGAAELKLIRDKGGLTIAQDKESSIVFGMPNEAISLNAAQYILPPERIASLLIQIDNNNKEVNI
ncbi:MAG: chemotaxis-specific protein-glutamate methyltransferase CheB [Ignavibacteriae bacterium]|nr:chemotaxis-specific protein-glutamate methyltransferase CheB [Ignavibacteriota bacterium]